MFPHKKTEDTTDKPISEKVVETVKETANKLGAKVHEGYEKVKTTIHDVTHPKDKK